MQVVVNISEDVYKHIMEMQFCILGIRSGKGLLNKILYAIRTGTPLPKGHGKLIDADAVIVEATERMKYPANHKYMECVIAHMNLAQTIIEADTEESEVSE